jgi:ketosteroid isomerase-like protein
MTLTKQQVREVLDVYIRAWEGQDPDLICTIFTDRATYHERVMGEPIRGRDGIRAYWQTKVVGGQANIKCDLLNLWLMTASAVLVWCGGQVTPEWQLLTGLARRWGIGRPVR